MISKSKPRNHVIYLKARAKNISLEWSTKILLNNKE